MNVKAPLARAAQLRLVEGRLARQDLAGLGEILAGIDVRGLVDIAERLPPHGLAVMLRMLPKDRALELFEALPSSLQSDLVRALQEDADISEMFARLDPDDRVTLLDELPASIANRMLRGLTAEERARTSPILGYDSSSIGRRMHPEVLTARPDDTAAATLAAVKAGAADASTIQTVVVVDDERRVQGQVSLRTLILADGDTPIRDILTDALRVEATTDAETASRDCVEQGLDAVPVVDSEQRLVGVLTLDDAAALLQAEAAEDTARQGGVEPLRRPYLATPVLRLVRTRIVWLLVLAIGALLTVQVLEVFEATLEQVTALALFVPLLIGTGGNTGNQAATTVTRALALDEIAPRDLLRVMGREMRVGAVLGIVLGALGFFLAGVVYGLDFGIVIGLTLLAVCTVAATVGSAIPIMARLVHADPAVFSNPFISTFLDASGLIIYFLIAKAVLGI